jgi:hypothetical protein
MRSSGTATALVALAAALAPATAAAQELVAPGPRQGYFVSGGLRAGLLGLRDADLGSLGLGASQGGVLRFGQMANDWIGFGLRVGGGAVRTAEWSFGYGGLSLDAQLVPSAALDLSLALSVGVAGGGVARLDPDAATDDDPTGGAGTLYTLGAAWEFFPLHDEGRLESGGLGLAAFVEGQLLDAGGLVAGGVFVGLDVSWWFGLARNRLDLPADAAY